MGTGMFDWDRDYDSMVAQRRIIPIPPAPKPLTEAVGDRQAEPARRAFSLTPVQALILGLVIGAIAASAPRWSAEGWLPEGWRTGNPVSVSGAFMIPDHKALAPAVTPPPPALQVYESRQQAAFDRAASLFSDADLQVLAATLTRDLQAARPRGFEAHGADLLALVRHELARRNAE